MFRMFSLSSGDNLLCLFMAEVEVIVVVVTAAVSALFEGSETVPVLALITVSFSIFVPSKGNGIRFTTPR